MCEKCGVSMRPLQKLTSRAAKCAATLAIVLLSAIFIAIFHGAGLLILSVIGVPLTIAILVRRSETRKLATMAQQQRAEYVARKQRERAAKQTARLQRAFGPLNPALVCPHCQTRGQVRTQQEVVKAGVSGGKATAAVLTGGISLLATGLSRMQHITAARCGECGSSWTF